MDEHRDRWWASPAAERGHVLRIPLEAPFRCQYGGTLADVQVCWEEWGRRNAAGDNTVLVVHPMTADPHLTGCDGGGPGWWEDLVGPGRAIDTDRWHVVCPNLPGGCYGSTGPRFPAPDGAPYLERFPLLTPRDLARLLRRFLDAIDVDVPALVVGPSMGGMIGWEWAIEHGDRVGGVVVVAAPLLTSPLQIGWNRLQVAGIVADTDDTGEVPRKDGQRVARGVGMLSYRSPAGLEEKFGRTWFQPPGATLAEPGLFNVESWLRQHGRRITKKYDPWTWRVFARTMDLHDVADGRDGLDAALDRVSCPVLVFGIRSDCLYPAADVRAGAERLAARGGNVRYVEIDSDHGHDAFLIDVDAIAGGLSGWWEATSPLPPPADGGGSTPRSR
ncbi:MAG TPA: homoserine O-acetyltransferase [bacterium]|nr:homoserine O-acetyltransferase [bacterium]